MKNTMKSCLKLRLSTVWVESERTGHYRPVGMATTLLRYGSQQNTRGMQHSVAMLKLCGKHSKQCRNNVVTLRFAENRRCKSSLLTSSWNRWARNFNLSRKKKITPSVFNKLSSYFWIVFSFTKQVHYCFCLLLLFSVWRELPSRSVQQKFCQPIHNQRRDGAFLFLRQEGETTTLRKGLKNITGRLN